MNKGIAETVLGITDSAIYDDEAVQLVKGQTVLVTGAGGSIGSEIVRQLDQLDAHVVCVDRDEYALYRLQLGRIGRALLTDDSMVLADISDKHQMNAIIADHQPALVFHAAACKHLPLMERSPAQAIITNIEGTANVASAASRNGVGRFVNISTDKAANPTCVLGQTKRLAENMVQQYASPSMQVASVRFGNVYGSRGSFIETLAYQIENDLPVTITDPEMARYFMTIPQAAGLVIQAAVLADNVSTFLLDMGEPYLIMDLVERYVKATGYPVPPIVFTGVRSGEKLDESLADRHTYPYPTSHPKIFGVHTTQETDGIRGLMKQAREGNTPDALRRVLAELTV